jgi:hypothetical protein
MGRSVFNHELWPKAWVVGLLAAFVYGGAPSVGFPQNKPSVSANVLGGPSILMPETTYDFGEVNEGVEVTHEFTVENKGNADLAIIKVSPDCGCTVARFDRVIPPGGKGKVRLELNLTGYKGRVSKTSTLECNDPSEQRWKLVMQGTVKAFIEISPSSSVSFRGRAEKLEPKTIELVGSSLPFHITGIQSNLEGRVAHELETIEEGKKYRLKLSNLLKQGDYNDSLWLHTDLPQKPYVMVRVIGAVEGEISVNPKTLFIGKMSAKQPVRSGSVLVIGSSGKPFKITKLTHDERFIAVTQTSLTDQNGYRLEITPKLEKLSPGARQQTVISIETDLVPEGRSEVLIHVLNAR